MKAAGVALAALLVVGAVLLLGGGGHRAPVAQAAPANTGRVERGRLSAVVSSAGTLRYRARPDGSPFVAVDRARGTYTALPEAGDEVGCGEVLYRVDDRPVRLLCGTVPAYRTLRPGDTGPDVRELNRALRVRGDVFTAATQRALGRAVLPLGAAVVLPGPARIAKVDAPLGAPAQPGAPVLRATSDTLHVQVDLDPSVQGQVRRGDRAKVTLPGGATVRGRVAGFGRIAEAPADQGPAAATIPTSIRLDDARRVRGLDRAPVQVDIVTAGVADALSVPVTALVGRTGGGFAVEAVRAGGRRDLVAVTVGLFDTAGGRVQVEGDLRAGERVAVPSL